MIKEPDQKQKYVMYKWRFNETVILLLKWNWFWYKQNKEIIYSSPFLGENNY